ncbi:MAG TPA: transcription-repair coupling factor, partial [Chthoniobacterales bacterium]
MEKPFASELLDRVAQSKPIARKLEQIATERAPAKFSHVIPPAQAFLSAIIARSVRKTIWILCSTVRNQDSVYETILNWLPSAQFLPEAEFAAVETVLPDPEIAAERLALLAKIDTEHGPHVIVTTRASLDQPAPKRGAVSSATLSVKRGASTTMEQLLEKLSGAGYDRVAQVTTRGQFAVRGGIVDLYSWQSPLPVRVEFFGDNVESLREFDIDTQTSVRDLRKIDILLGAADDKSGVVRDYIGKDDLTIDIEPEESSDAKIQ